ncbi:unnamed protein product [Phaedon cochleariae]|uniref:Uncharacterized protein n=1 Tax=Phaedon cochleariae TaxID=80249 RepID=A0A9N9SJ70_PHACE|nr:unnamed protein product [Phaedon cochleariae]
MSRKGYFEGVLPNECKHQTNIDNYMVQKQLVQYDNLDVIREKFYAFQEPNSNISEPKVCLWEFMKRDELEYFLKMNKNEQINAIDSKMNKDVPKGKARTVFIELMYNTMKFCESHGFNLEKSAVILSQFYLTHIYFTSTLDTSAEKVFTYFKELTLCHSLPFPPHSSRFLSHKETNIVLELFCKLYLRNLPLIRFLSLPNFALFLHYDLEPDIVAKNESVKTTKDTKDKKNKLKKEKSKSKKGKK